MPGLRDDIAPLRPIVNKPLLQQIKEGVFNAVLGWRVGPTGMKQDVAAPRSLTNTCLLMWHLLLDFNHPQQHVICVDHGALPFFVGAVGQLSYRCFSDGAGRTRPSWPVDW